ncbi:MAG: glycosyltransferase [Deltaproteobacteria bacterium]|nr:glycosyltransferase [Deltaproteobacteria bacterium]
MKIYVCIPSFNEEQTISNVVTLVDQGLQVICSSKGLPIEVKIVNIDSASEDNTVANFKTTFTTFPKESVSITPPRGKGKNLLAFIRKAYIEKATYCLTIDVDIKSASPRWIIDLLKPILDNQADFVTPLYQRSRFEGSSTNHFAFPMVFATTGATVRQPIAGDFAFNSKLIDIIHNVQVPDFINCYGIDIFLTLSALTKGLAHKQVMLDQKLHNPSFTKLEYMFPQIAASTLFTLREVGIRTSSIIPSEIQSTNIASGISFSHKSAAIEMQQRALLLLNSINPSEFDWISCELFQKIRSSGDITSSEWVIILANWLKKGLLYKHIDELLLANQLLPFFIIRAINFWKLSEKLNAIEVENQLYNQAKELGSFLYNIVNANQKQL